MINHTARSAAAMPIEELCDGLNRFSRVVAFSYQFLRQSTVTIYSKLNVRTEGNRRMKEKRTGGNSLALKARNFQLICCVEGKPKIRTHRKMLPGIYVDS